MKKFRVIALCCALFLLAGCAPKGTADDGKLHILATTYPVYLFTTAVTDGVEGVQVDLLVNEQVSCLHNYTLTVTDMKAIENADVVMMSGVGLEDFMSDALAQSDATAVVCSEKIALLTLGTVGSDPHIWMDPNRAVTMTENIKNALVTADSGNAPAYEANFTAAKTAVTEWLAAAPAVSGGSLITFHDGFQYFSEAFHLTLLKSIEEEEGAETSAAEIREIVALIGEHQVPAIFTEQNGSTATADAISRECGVKVAQLNMIMSGEGTGMAPYLTAMDENIKTIAEALA
ncbi:MAG: metal ABC transporter substrate-binding protein [Oscillospiraceae bacterium]